MEKQKGFSLLEVILAISALALTSMFILQMFMVASELNGRAKDTDAAMAQAIASIEALKSYNSLDGYLSFVNGDGSGGSYGTTTDSEGKMIFCRYFDEKWQPVDEDSAERRFFMELTLQEAKNDIVGQDGMLYAVSVHISGDKHTLADIQTMKYFTKGA